MVVRLLPLGCKAHLREAADDDSVRRDPGLKLLVDEAAEVIDGRFDAVVIDHALRQLLDLVDVEPACGPGQKPQFSKDCRGVRRRNAPSKRRQISTWHRHPSVERNGPVRSRRKDPLDVWKPEAHRETRQVLPAVSCSRLPSRHTDRNYC